MLTLTRHIALNSKQIADKLLKEAALKSDIEGVHVVKVLHGALELGADRYVTMCHIAH